MERGERKKKGGGRAGETKREERKGDEGGDERISGETERMQPKRMQNDT